MGAAAGGLRAAPPAGHWARRPRGVQLLRPPRRTPLRGPRPPRGGAVAGPRDADRGPAALPRPRQARRFLPGGVGAGAPEDGARQGGPAAGPGEGGSGEVTGPRRPLQPATCHLQVAEPSGGVRALTREGPTPPCAVCTRILHLRRGDANGAVRPAAERMAGAPRATRRAARRRLRRAAPPLPPCALHLLPRPPRAPAKGLGEWAAASRAQHSSSLEWSTVTERPNARLGWLTEARRRAGRRRDLGCDGRRRGRLPGGARAWLCA